MNGADADLLALRTQLDAYVQAWVTHVEDEGAGASEEYRLRVWGERLFPAIAAARVTTPAGWTVKFGAIEYMNAVCGLDSVDRIAGAGSYAEGLAWALVRDLLAERGQTM